MLMGLKQPAGFEAHWLFLLYGFAVATATTSGSSRPGWQLWLTQASAYLVAYVLPAVWLCSYSLPACQWARECREDESSNVLLSGLPPQIKEPSPHSYAQLRKPTSQTLCSSIASSKLPSSDVGRPAVLSSISTGSPLRKSQHLSSGLSSGSSSTTASRSSTSSSSSSRVYLSNAPFRTPGLPGMSEADACSDADACSVSTPTSSCMTPQGLSIGDSSSDSNKGISNGSRDSSNTSRSLYQEASGTGCEVHPLLCCSALDSDMLQLVQLQKTELFGDKYCCSSSISNTTPKVSNIAAVTSPAEAPVCSAPREPSAQEASAQDASAQEASAQEASAQEAAPQEASAQEASPQEASALGQRRCSPLSVFLATSSRSSMVLRQPSLCSPSSYGSRGAQAQHSSCADSSSSPVPMPPASDSPLARRVMQQRDEQGFPLSPGLAELLKQQQQQQPPASEQQHQPLKQDHQQLLTETENQQRQHQQWQHKRRQEDVPPPPWVGLRLRSISATLAEHCGSNRPVSPSASNLCSPRCFNSHSGLGVEGRPAACVMKPVLRRWGTFAALDQSQADHMLGGNSTAAAAAAVVL